MKKYILLLLFSINFLHAFGFKMESDYPMAWIYVNNFLDFLVLIIGMFISSFLYFFLLNPIIVPLLFLYIIFEIFKFLIAMLKTDENIYNNPIFNGKIFFKFLLKFIGLSMFFVAIPTGILVLTAKEDTTVSTSSTNDTELKKMINSYVLNDPKPLDMSLTGKDFGFDTGIFSTVPDVPLSSFFKSFDSIQTLENQTGAKITSGEFKIYLPAVLTVPIYMVESLLYGSYDRNTETWQPGFFPKLFNTPESNYKKGIFSLLVYSPSLIFQAIFEQDNFNNDIARSDIPFVYYKLGFLRLNYFAKLNKLIEEVNHLATINYYKIFFYSVKMFYQNNFIPIENGISFNSKLKLLPIYDKSEEIKTKIDNYIEEVLNTIKSSEENYVKSFSNNNLINIYSPLGDLNSPLIFNVNYINPNIITYVGNSSKDLFLKSINNLNDIKLILNTNDGLFIYIPDTNKYKLEQNEDNKKVLVNYLAKIQLPYIEYDKDKKIFYSPNLAIKKINIVNTFLNEIELYKPIDIFIRNFLDLTNIDKTYLKNNLTLVLDSDYVENKNLPSVNSSTLNISGDGSFYKKLNENSINPLFLFLKYPIYSLVTVLKYDINSKLGKEPIYKKDGQIISYVPPGEAEYGSGLKTPDSIRKYYKKNIELYLLKTLKEPSLNFTTNSYITNLKQVPGSNSLYIDPFVIATANISYMIDKNLLNKDNIFYQLIKDISDKFYNQFQTLFSLTEEDKTNFIGKLTYQYTQGTLEKVIKYKKELQDLKTQYINNYNAIFTNLANKYVNFYIARYTKPDEKELKKTGQFQFDNKGVTYTEGENDSWFDKIINSAISKIVSFILYILYNILNGLLNIIKWIAGLLFSVMYSLHVLGIIILFILGPFKFLFNVIFKDEYEETFNLFKQYLSYRMIDFVYILLLYILGIAYPVILYIISVSTNVFSFIVTFIVEVLLIGFTFILVGRFIKLVFEIFSINENGFNLSGLYDNIGKGIISKGVDTGSRSTVIATMSGLALGKKAVSTVSSIPFIENSKSVQSLKNLKTNTRNLGNKIVSSPLFQGGTNLLYGLNNAIKNPFDLKNYDRMFSLKSNNSLFQNSTALKEINNTLENSKKAYNANSNASVSNISSNNAEPITKKLGGIIDDMFSSNSNQNTNSNNNINKDSNKMNETTNIFNTNVTNSTNINETNINNINDTKTTNTNNINDKINTTNNINEKVNNTSSEINNVIEEVFNKFNKDDKK